MNSFVACEVIVIPAIPYPVDGKNFFERKVRAGQLSWWESFRLKVWSAFGYQQSTKESRIQRWELATALSLRETMDQFPDGADVRFWELKHLLYPMDDHGVALPSVLRSWPKSLMRMRAVDVDHLAVPLVDVSQLRSGNFRLKLAEDSGAQCTAGQSFFARVIDSES